VLSCKGKSKLGEGCLSVLINIAKRYSSVAGHQNAAAEKHLVPGGDSPGIRKEEGAASLRASRILLTSDLKGELCCELEGSRPTGAEDAACGGDRRPEAGR
jgi:hypothetical protein